MAKLTRYCRRKLHRGIQILLRWCDSITEEENDSFNYGSGSKVEKTYRKSPSANLIHLRRFGSNYECDCDLSIPSNKGNISTSSSGSQINCKDNDLEETFNKTQTTTATVEEIDGVNKVKTNETRNDSQDAIIKFPMVNQKLNEDRRNKKVKERNIHHPSPKAQHSQKHQAYMKTDGGFVTERLIPEKKWQNTESKSKELTKISVSPGKCPGATSTPKSSPNKGIGRKK